MSFKKIDINITHTYIYTYIYSYHILYKYIYLSYIIYIYIYIYIQIYTNLPVNVIARLPHPRSRDSQGQETFLAPSADNQTRIYTCVCVIFISIFSISKLILPIKMYIMYELRVSWLERLDRIQWSWVQIALRSTFYSYFKESVSGEYHIFFVRSPHHKHFSKAQHLVL